MDDAAYIFGDCRSVLVNTINSESTLKKSVQLLHTICMRRVDYGMDINYDSIVADLLTRATLRFCLCLLMIMIIDDPSRSPQGRGRLTWLRKNFCYIIFYSFSNLHLRSQIQIISPSTLPLYYQLSRGVGQHRPSIIRKAHHHLELKKLLFTQQLQY